MIAFVGSVFSPYYAWSGRGDPENHVAINVALYGPSARWCMTERGRRRLRRDGAVFEVGRSRLSWSGTDLVVDIDEAAAPWPSPVRGRIRVSPRGLCPATFPLDATDRHFWRPIAPTADFEVAFTEPAVSWSGLGYFDRNWGHEPLEAGFRDWSWSRAHRQDGAAILYDAQRRDGSWTNLALRIGEDGRAVDMPRPPVRRLPRGFWGVARATRSDGPARIVRTLEDAPFYTRSLVAAASGGAPALAMHESLDLDRVASPIVRLMLPFRMPRLA